MSDRFGKFKVSRLGKTKRSTSFNSTKFTFCECQSYAQVLKRGGGNKGFGFKMFYVKHHKVTHRFNGLGKNVMTGEN